MFTFSQVNFHNRSFPHLRLMIGLATKVFRRVLLLEQELLTIPEHMSLLMVFCGVRIAKSSVLCAVGGSI
jgi:hypothetical protein